MTIKRSKRFFIETKEKETKFEAPSGAGKTFTLDSLLDLMTKMNEELNVKTVTGRSSAKTPEIWKPAPGENKVTILPPAVGSWDFVEFEKKAISRLTRAERRAAIAKAEGQYEGTKSFRTAEPSGFWVDEDGYRQWIGAMPDNQIIGALMRYLTKLTRSHEEAIRYCLLFITDAPEDTQEVYMNQHAEFVQAFKQFPRMKGLMKEALKRNLYIPERSKK